MKEKLLSILKNRRGEKGFTLIELLVVIAIIAILVVIVVVAINPVQRLNDATDRTAASNVRSAGTLISVCITQALSQTPPGTLNDCDDEAAIELLGEGNIPADVDVNDDADPATNICAYQVQSGTNRFAQYQSDTGEVEEGVGVVAPATVPACP